MFSRIKTWALNRTINKYIKTMKPGLQLKLVALVALLAAVTEAARLLLDGDSATNPDWTITISLIGSAWGNLISRQNDVSSEEAAGKSRPMNLIK